GSGNNGTLTGSTLPIWTTGQMGGALSFNGSSGDVDLGTGSSLNVTGPITLSAWVKLSASQYSDILVRGSDTSAGGSDYKLVYDPGSGGRFGFYISDGTNKPGVYTAGPIAVGTWYHVVAVWDGTTNAGSLSIYLNGTLSNTAASNAAAIQSMNTHAAIGADGLNSRYYFNGTIDDVRVYDRALSAADVSSLYSGSTASSTPDISGLTTLIVNQNGSGNFTTIQACADAVQPGQTCLVYPGAYDEHVVTKAAGTASAPIVFQATGGTAAITGFDVDHAYVTVKGFDVSNGGTAAGITVNEAADHAVISGNYVHDTGLDAAIQGSCPSDGSDGTNGSVAHPAGVVVSDNHIYHSQYGIIACGADWTVSGNDVERLYKYSSEPYSDADYIRFFGVGHTFTDNYLHGSLWSETEALGAHVDCFQTFDSGSASYVKDITIKGNLCEDAADLVIIQGQNELQDDQIAITGNVTANLFTGAGDGAGWDINNASNVTVENNTFYDLAGTGGLFKSGTMLGTNLIRDNIFDKVTKYAYLYWDPTVTDDHNLIFDSGPAEPEDPSTIIGKDPLFVAPTDVVGLDGVPFTADDGLIPATTSPACSGGYGGTYVGAYPCGSPSTPSTPSNSGSGSSVSTPGSGSSSGAVSGGTGGTSSGGFGGGGAAITASANSGASNSAAMNSNTTPCVASPSAIPASALSLSIGTRGSSVTNLQTFLVIMGYLQRQYITGYFGPLTKAALTSYQLAHPSTCSNTQAPSNNNQTSSNNQISIFTRSLKLGMIGNDVKNLQIFLNQHNFTVSQSGAGSSGHETTYFGPATFRALIRFQNAYANQILAPYGLSQGTGFFGPSTMKEINSLLIANH
ncbi:MAG: peptidoglycan-binding protein, partial [Patescibacteria group bacterium]|nr:peptidoglycan-binding protein [Patescibacteria group bacterium]